MTWRVRLLAVPLMFALDLEVRFVGRGGQQPWYRHPPITSRTAAPARMDECCQPKPASS